MGAKCWEDDEEEGRECERARGVRLKEEEEEERDRKLDFRPLKMAQNIDSLGCWS